MKDVIAGFITHELDARGLSQADAAKLLRTGQPKVSGLYTGELRGVSMMRMLTWVTRLGLDVEIRITPGEGVIRVPAISAAEAGRRGGHARARKMTMAQRRASATLAVVARWGKRR